MLSLWVEGQPQVQWRWVSETVSADADLLAIHLPRVRCECGGSVGIDFGGLLRPYQRIWGDGDAQIRQWGALAVSLRHTCQELAHLHIGPLALRTLNRRLNQLADLTPDRNATDVPPVLQTDAIWITLLRPFGIREILLDRSDMRFFAPDVCQGGTDLPQSPGAAIIAAKRMPWMQRARDLWLASVPIPQFPDRLRAPQRGRSWPNREP